MSLEALLNLRELERQNGLPEGLLSSVMKAESGGNPSAVSPAGAIGLFQFMPATAKQYGIDPRDPQQSAFGAAKMYGDLMRKYGDMPSALAAYNWGQGNVDRKGLENAPKETRNYIQKVLGGIGEMIVPSAHAEEMPDDGFTEEEIRAELESRGETPRKTTQEPSVQEIEAELAQREGKETSLPKKAYGALQAFTQGITSGFGDEISAGMAAPIISALSKDVSLSDAYDQAVGQLRSENAQFSEENPLTALASDIAGMVGGGSIISKGAGALAKIVPRGTEALSTAGRLAAENPVRAAGLIGASAGAARGAGEGTDAESRAGGAMVGGTIGAAGGIGVGYAAQKIGGALGKTANKLNKSPIKSKGGGETISNLEQGADELFPKTAGQKTQLADVQRLESAALSGTISPEAEQAGLNALQKQNASIRSYLSKIGGNITSGRDINALIDDVSGTIAKKYETAKKGVDEAYKIARGETGSVRDGVKIDRDSIREGLWKNIGAVRREAQYDVSEMPAARKVLQRLARYSLKGDEGTVTPTFLGELENWRTMATTKTKGLLGKPEGRFLNQMIRQYDDFMEKTAANAANEGDAVAIKAFRNAVKSRANMGRLFERNAVVEKLAKGQLSVDDARSVLLGTGSIKGKRQMAETLDAILKASGDEAATVADDLRNTFMRRVVERSEGGFVSGSQTEKMISPAKLKTELENLFVQQSEFAERLWGKPVVDEARKAIRELALMSSKQISTSNPPGSGETVIRFVKSLINKVPVVNQGVALAGKGAQALNQSRQTKQAIQSFSGLLPDSFVPKAKIWGGKTAGLSSVSGGLSGRGTGEDIQL